MLITKENIDTFEWHTCREAQEMRTYYEPLVKNGISPYITNGDGSVLLWTQENQAYPLVVADKKRQNKCYFTSPASQFSSFLIPEVNKGLVKNRVSKKVIIMVLKLLRFFYRVSHLDRVVYVNHFLFSTNLYGSESKIDINELVSALQASFPKHAIVFKCLLYEQHTSIIEATEHYKAKQIAIRQVFLFDSGDASYRKKRPFIQDCKLYEKSDELQWRKITKREIPKALQLYSSLYLDKHNPLNPQYTNEYLTLCISGNRLQLFGVFWEDKLLGITLFFERQGHITTPLIGYDQDAPKKLGIYRQLNYHLMQKAISEKLLLNMSSGAGKFKTQRGGKPAIEYIVVIDNHVGKVQRLGWNLVRFLANRFAKPVFEKSII